MTKTTLSSLERNRDDSDYRRLPKRGRNIADALAMPDVEEVEFDPPRIAIDCTEADLS
ncbi:prevent-host-death protein [Chitinimonas arctica]|uniref:Prevent-host-death protein n=1 Tax=Chitinimonas arctica TaxID=2594795 RepID=A0A516SB45_9NEIS|nr:prevent-host-death protein [Chitinimonas arctica]